MPQIHPFLTLNSHSCTALLCVDCFPLKTADFWTTRSKVTKSHIQLSYAIATTITRSSWLPLRPSQGVLQPSRWELQSLRQLRLQKRKVARSDWPYCLSREVSSWSAVELLRQLQCRLKSHCNQVAPAVRCIHCYAVWRWFTQFS